MRERLDWREMRPGPEADAVRRRTPIRGGYADSPFGDTRERDELNWRKEYDAREAARFERDRRDAARSQGEHAAAFSTGDWSRVAADPYLAQRALGDIVDKAVARLAPGRAKDLERLCRTVAGAVAANERYRAIWEHRDKTLIIPYDAMSSVRGLWPYMVRPGELRPGELLAAGWVEEAPGCWRPPSVVLEGLRLSGATDTVLVLDPERPLPTASAAPAPAPAPAPITVQLHYETYDYPDGVYGSESDGYLAKLADTGGQCSLDGPRREQREVAEMDLEYLLAVDWGGATLPEVIAQLTTHGCHER